ncbi:septal ring lytic transglycosylase RlpA family protein [Vibrio sp.]|nr:septal ring lytic transglycosylase RlpA family protein [Vibrio sp.]
MAATSTLCLVLSACNSSGRYHINSDIAPTTPISVEGIDDAKPRYELYSLKGNNDYQLRGGHYQIIRDTTDFQQQGIASWYGAKFHGYETSNGEIYDMYSMTAAHKTLPLPSYVKVTNKDNGQHTIVRINDRGPFHEGRIIDLSYAAATKLGVIETGTANVVIEVIHSDKPQHGNSTDKAQAYIIQVASSSKENNSRTLAQNLSQSLRVGSFIESNDDFHRIYLGPFTDYKLTYDVLNQVKVMGHNSAFVRKHIVTQ